MYRSAILFIDDEPGVREIAQRGLHSAGHVCFVAKNGDEGLAAASKQTFDVIVLDIIMPGKEGVETIIELKRRRPEQKVLAISGGGQIGPDEFLKLAIFFGADATLSKPFGPAALVEAVEALREKAAPTAIANT